jgi:2-oxoglutarate dehydrogenase E1 component
MEMGTPTEDTMKAIFYWDTQYDYSGQVDGSGRPFDLHSAPSSVNAKEVKRLILCTGKVYYDLKARQVKDKRKDVAIVRLEQLYPMPEEQSWKLIEKYKHAEKEWVQEEPKNMGAFTFLRRYVQFDEFKLIARKSSASPATGHASVHAQEQAKILNQAFAEKIETV